jgi:hypothetical protein
MPRTGSVIAVLTLLVAAGCGGGEGAGAVQPSPSRSAAGTAVNTCARAHQSKHVAYLVVQHLQTGSARLLPRLIGSRRRGPLFLAERPPVPSRAPAAADLCPETRRARLSYRRAEELFVVATRGRSLHDLRRATLTHLGKDNVSLPLLMAKSRHKNLRSFQRYVRPSPEAVAALTAQHDPARRRGS